MDWIRFPTFTLNAWEGMRRFVRSHKIIALALALALLYVLWQGYVALTATPAMPHYLTTTVATDTVVASVSETGQVAAATQIDLAAKASGEVFSVLVSPGEHVAAGTALATIDPTTEQESVTSAEQGLESAQIALNKDTAPSAAPDTAYNDVATTVTDLSTVVTGLNSVLHDSTVPSRTFQSNEDAYHALAVVANPGIEGETRAAESSYQAARAAFVQIQTEMAATPRDASDAALATLVQDAYSAAAAASTAVEDTHTFLLDVQTTLTNTSGQVPSTLAGHLSSVEGYATTINGDVSTLKGDLSTASGNTYNLQSDELTIQEKQLALQQAEEALSDTVVRAPFNGTVAAIAIEPHQTISTGTTVATMTSDNEGVDISVNEVDAAKLALGQKATITFDALPSVTIAGTVSSVNTVGTASQGVVSYDAVVTFDTPNAQVLPGMSATTNIVTGTATGLVVPITAIQTANGQSTVQVFNPPLPAAAIAAAGTAGVTSPAPPVVVPVTLGLTNDTTAIVTSGLSAGDEVVTKTVAGTSQTALPSAPSGASLLRGGGGARGGAGAGGAVLFRGG